MVEYSRRALLVGGGLVAGAAVLGAAVVGSTAVSEERGSWVPSSGTGRITRSPNPRQIASIVPRTSGTVMQQIELASTGDLYMTQSLTGSGPGLYTTVVSRNQGPSVSTVQNLELDSMTVIDGGHGLGLHIEPTDGGQCFVWLSLQGEVSQGDPNGGRLARFAYTPGVFTIYTIPGGVGYLPQFPNAYGEHQEAIYNFDWAKDSAVERMYDFHTGRQERLTRRSISDIVHGVDEPLGRITLPVNPPTLQGFATVDNTLFRWDGVSNSGSGAIVAGDPMAMEQWDWSTGVRIGTKPFPTLGQTLDGAWRDGAYEPEGCSVFRNPDGTASLLVGVALGVGGDHEWLVFEFPGIGAA